MKNWQSFFLLWWSDKRNFASPSHENLSEKLSASLDNVIFDIGSLPALFVTNNRGAARKKKCHKSIEENRYTVLRLVNSSDSFFSPPLLAFGQNQEENFFAAPLSSAMSAAL
jgi:hypothetical protein